MTSTRLPFPPPAANQYTPELTPRSQDDAVPVPAPIAVQPERFADPLTGSLTLGVGVTWEATPAPGTTLTLAYDNTPRVQMPVTSAGIGIQAPLEPGIQRVQVIVRQGSEETRLLDDPVETFPLRPQPEPVVTPEHGVTQERLRLTSALQTARRAMISGELLKPGWWGARLNRYLLFARRGLARLATARFQNPRLAPRDPYAAFCAQTDPTAADLVAMRQAVAGFQYTPTFSVLMPVYNVAPFWLSLAIDSVLEQVYPHWQLILADDASTNPNTAKFLDNLAKSDRLIVIRRPTNGHIVAATRTAAEHATGEFLCFLDNDDFLAPQALFRYAEALQTQPDTDLFYSDEDKLTADRVAPNGGVRYDPQFKPAWSPDLLLSYNYVNHFTAIRRSAYESIGGLQPGRDGAQDLDLLLRLTETTDRIVHIPEVLYHWRAIPESSAADAGVKPYVHHAASAAVTAALARRDVHASWGPAEFAQKLGLPVLAPIAPARRPTVAILVYGPPKPVKETISAVKSRTHYDGITTQSIHDDAPTAHALNQAAQNCPQDVLVFLEAGLEPVHDNWLDCLTAVLADASVGAVGGLVFAPDGRLASAGTVLAGKPVHASAGVTPNPVTYYFYAESTRTVSSTGRGLLATRRSQFEQLNGFDTPDFGRTLFDVDYCQRLANSRLRTVHVGEARFRAQSPEYARRDAPTERLKLRERHPSQSDPFVSPNLTIKPGFAVNPSPPGQPRRARPVPEVLYATHNLSQAEGAPQVLAQIALGLQARGTARANLFAPAPGPAAVAFTQTDIPVRIGAPEFASLYISAQWSPSEYRRAVRNLTRIIRAKAVEVVVANTLVLFPVVEAAARAGVPVIWIIHESYSPTHWANMMSPFARERCQGAFGLAERVVFVSSGCADLYRRFDARSTFSVVHNAIDYADIKNYCTHTTQQEAQRKIRASPMPLRFVTVGTVCERKAQHIIVEAAAIVARTRRDFVCSFVGAREGLPYRSYVENLAVARGVADCIELVPETPEVWPHLRAADVFICASHVEAFSLSVLEALAFGLPVLSTPCGGLEEQVTWGENALRFAFDDAQQLAGHMIMLLENATLRLQMGTEARAEFELHPGPGEMLDRYAEILLCAREQAHR